MMYFHIFSDIHLEFCNHYSMKSHINKINRCGIDEKDEINLILAGDIGYPEKSDYKKFIVSCANLYDNVFVIAGNHEFYKKSLDETNQCIDKIYSELKDEQINNIYYLNNNIILHNNVYIIGSTLWTYVSEDNKKYHYNINDYRIIKGFTVDINNKLYEENYKFLETSINYVKEQNAKCIIITHHLPSYSVIHNKYKDYLELSPFFATDCDKLIQEPIIAWFYGHTHTHKQDKINNIDLICNPKGYPSEYPTYNKKLVLRV